MLSTSLLTGIVTIYKTNSLDQVMGSRGYTAGELELAREIAVREELQFRNIEILGDLIRLGMGKKRHWIILCPRRNIATSVAEPKKRDDGILG